MTHTPAPWEIPSWHITKDSPHTIPIWSHGGIIAIVEGERGSKTLSTEKLLSNARLIAAAPELLEALKRIQEMAEEDLRMDLGGTNLYQIEADACAAIAKVEG